LKAKVSQFHKLKNININVIEEDNGQNRGFGPQFQGPFGQFQGPFSQQNVLPRQPDTFIGGVHHWPGQNPAFSQQSGLSVHDRFIGGVHHWPGQQNGVQGQNSPFNVHQQFDRFSHISITPPEPSAEATGMHTFGSMVDRRPPSHPTHGQTILVMPNKEEEKQKMDSKMSDEHMESKKNEEQNDEIMG
jgi:hypothetical protein